MRENHPVTHEVDDLMVGYAVVVIGIVLMGFTFWAMLVI